MGSANEYGVATVSRLFKKYRSFLRKSPAKETYILQKRLLRSLLLVAIPYFKATLNVWKTI